MFSGLANYFFGGVEESNVELVDNTEEDAVRTCETEDEWVLVDTSGKAGRRNSDSDAELSLDGLEGLGSEEEELRTEKVEEMNVSPSPSCSNRTTPQLMEGSWYITPPPSFTASGQSVILETSSMENILIEHPSMSVYQGRRVPLQVRVGKKESSRRKKENKKQKGSTANSENVAPVEMEPILQQPLQPMLCPQRPHNVNIIPSPRLHMLVHLETNKMPQASQRGYEERRLTRRQLARYNKVRDVQAQCKRPRRKDFMATPSGRSNNRKCSNSNY